MTRDVILDRGSALVADMEGFLRAGGIVSYSEWSELDIDTKAALVAASHRIRSEFAALIGRATHGPEGYADVVRDLDDGEAKVRLALTAVMDQASMRVIGK